MNTILTKLQKKTFGPRNLANGEVIVATVRHDDQCGNGHNTFSITGEITKRGVFVAGGCCHEEIAKAFPELAPLIKWHLCSTDMPMHYFANVIYHAGDRDCWGLRKGEFRQHTSRGQQADGVPGVPHWELCAPKGALKDVYSHEKPAPVTLEWQPSGMTGEGKERDFKAARSCAIWPEATDEQLRLPPDELKALLEARLPKLMGDFKAAVESFGFVY